MENQEETRTEEQVKEVTHLAWFSPSRVFKKRDKEYYKNVGAIVFLLVIILVFAREYMFILAVLSIVFFIYVTSTVPPEEVKHKITNLGVESAGHFYRWEEFTEFWFDQQWSQQYVVLRPVFGPLIMMLLGSENKEKIQTLMSKYLPFREEPQKNWVDNAATWLTKKVPLEKPQS